MDIFSFICLVDTVISATNGFIALYEHLNASREKTPRQNVYAHVDGRRYEGTLRDGAADGNGVLTYPDGTRCEGEFRQGEPVGRVVISWPNGRKEAGEWRNRRFYPDDMRQTMPVKLSASGATVSLDAHPAMASDEPFFLEYAGDTASDPFDRWFCYQKAFEQATALKAANLERVLQKIALLETEPNVSRAFFERIARSYETALDLLCRRPDASAATFADAIRDLEDGVEFLESSPSTAAFFAPALNCLRQAQAAAIAGSPALRRQYPALLAEFAGFRTDTLRLHWEGSTQTFLIFAKSRITLGRSDQPGQASDLFVIDTKDPAQKTAISRFHAIIESASRGCRIMPDKNHYHIWIERGTQTLDVTRPIILEPHDLIWLGNRATGQGIALRYAAFYADNAATPDMPLDKNATLADDAGCRTLTAARLTVERGIAPYRIALLCVAACAIGRDAANPLQLDDQRVSRNQAVIRHQNGGFWLQDAGSRNGTFINDAPCAEATPLVAGDTMRFGKYVALRVG